MHGRTRSKALEAIVDQRIWERSEHHHHAKGEGALIESLAIVEFDSRGSSLSA